MIDDEDKKDIQHKRQLEYRFRYCFRDVLVVKLSMPSTKLASASVGGTEKQLIYALVSCMFYFLRLSVSWCVVELSGKSDFDVESTSYLTRYTAVLW